MQKIKSLISVARPVKAADYLALFRKIDSEMRQDRISGGKKVKIALLSSSTISGLREILFTKCCESGILPEIRAGSYGQYAQDILSPNSWLYQFNPDIVILWTDTLSLLGDSYFNPYEMTGVQRRKFAEEKADGLKSLVKALRERSGATIILHNLEVPMHSPMGILEEKQDFGFHESIRHINSRLSETFREDARVFVFNYDEFCSNIGKQQVVDHKMYYLGDIRIDIQLMPALCDKYIAYVKPLLSLSKKCLVLDLDNTLWGGILGEDGFEGIHLGPTPEGRPFLEFQKSILALFRRGVILAINSKNNAEEVLRVMREHPSMVLKERNFAAMKINWNDKITNMHALAKELNIGLDSLVFFDDDPANRQIVKAALPEVLVVDVPSDPALYMQTLNRISDFDTLAITTDDLKKGQMYAEQRQRQELQEKTEDISKYLEQLETKVSIEQANAFTMPRISQLTQKTNQFNMTTKRYLEEDIRMLSESQKSWVISAKVEDKFGDNGITGALIIRKDSVVWEIDTFLISCRVLGRGVEETLLAHLIEQAQKAGVQKLVGKFIPTNKNAPAKEFFKKNGFMLLKNENGAEYWEYPLAKQYPFPSFIKVEVKGAK